MNKWKRVCITDVCESIVDCINKTAPIIDQPSPFKMIRTTNIRNGQVNLESTRYVTEEIYNQWIRRQVPKQGDILLTREAPMGEVGILLTDDYVFLGQRIVSYRTNSDQLNNKFLLYAFQSDDLQNQIKALASGSTVQHMRVPDTKALKIPLPPLSEQKRIVSIVDQAFEGIDRAIANTKKNLTNARELFDSVLCTAIFSDSDQKNWHLRTVADVALSKKGSIRTGPFGSQLLHGEFVDQGIAVLGIDNAVDNEFRWGKRRFITTEKFRQLSRYKVNPGDVLITIMGTCGRCAIVPNDIPTAINTKHLCCITLDRGQCLPGFLHVYFLYHPIAQQFLAERAKGSIMSGLNMEIIKELPLRLPPISKQQIIIEKVGYLSYQIRSLEAIYQQKLAALNKLKQSILQKAFTGELTADIVNQTVKKAEEAIAA
jgi:type I restriction enzyme, S subunit